MLQGEHSAILLTFIKLPFVIKIFVLSILEWPFYTGFPVLWYFSCSWMSLIVANVKNLNDREDQEPTPKTRRNFGHKKVAPSWIDNIILSVIQSLEILNTTQNNI